MVINATWSGIKQELKFSGKLFFLSLPTNRSVNMPKTKTTPEEILRASWSVFHEHGYHDASLQQLADAAGLGKAGILHHFGSKAGVMRAVIDYAVDWYHRKVYSTVRGEGTIEERLEKLLRRQYKLCLLNDNGGCFFANTILETAGGGQFAEGLKRFHVSWNEAVAELLAERFSPEEAKERAYRIFIDYQGSVMLFKLYQDAGHIEQLIQRCLNGLDLPISTD